MKKKILGIISLVVVLGAGWSIYASFGRSKTTSQYQFEEIARGNVENTVSSTGTISAVGTVEVGTQVSGTIARLYVDFNDKVNKGQLLAVLDTVLLRATVLDARASVEIVQAQMEQAQADYNRNLALFEKKLLSEAEFLPFRIKIKTQQASLKASQATLERTQHNLRYAVIRSPIKGTVIQRNVEAGQTVAASLSAPTLFIIAEDLSQMEIHALVNESDIGQIKEGQKVRFEVQAHPDKKFSGTVKQIRLQPSNIQNVVNYTVVVNAANDQGLLLPGMTATVDFVIEQKQDVLLVANAALRFQPTPEMMEEMRKRRESQANAMPDSMRAQFRERMGNRGGEAGGNFRRGDFGGFPGMGGGSFGGQMPRDRGRLWHLDGAGNLTMAMIRTGVTDGRMTEIVMGRNVEEGLKVISGVSQPNAPSNTAARSSNPVQGMPGMGRRPF